MVSFSYVLDSDNTNFHLRFFLTMYRSAMHLAQSCYFILVPQRNLKSFTKCELTTSLPLFKPRDIIWSIAQSANGTGKCGYEIQCEPCSAQPLQSPTSFSLFVLCHGCWQHCPCCHQNRAILTGRWQRNKVVQKIEPHYIGFASQYGTKKISYIARTSKQAQRHSIRITYKKEKLC